MVLASSGMGVRFLRVNQRPTGPCGRSEWLGRFVVVVVVVAVAWNLLALRAGSSANAGRLRGALFARAPLNRKTRASCARTATGPKRPASPANKWRPLDQSGRLREPASMKEKITRIDIEMIRLRHESHAARWLMTGEPIAGQRNTGLAEDNNAAIVLILVIGL